jgi:chaperonin GroEL (HSP60 family)
MTIYNIYCLDEENNMFKSMVDKISSAGANVVLCQKGIDDIAVHYLARAGILAVKSPKWLRSIKLKQTDGFLLKDIRILKLCKS